MVGNNKFELLMLASGLFLPLGERAGLRAWIKCHRQSLAEVDRHIVVASFDLLL